jgi:GR25 family glycosyltransferase involved in LPS biosynthesis
MVFIDKVYVVNLDSNKERLVSIDKELKTLGGVFGDYTRLSAVNGKELGEDYIKNITSECSYFFLKNKLRYNHYQIDSVGAIGCFLSHKAIWEDIIKNNYQNVIVLEDDITFRGNSIEQINKYISNLPIDYNIAYLGYTNQYFSNSNKVNDYWNSSNDLYIFETSGYIINNRLAKKLINNKIIDCHVDLYINFFCSNNNIKRLYSAPKLVYQKENYGSIIQHSNGYRTTLNYEINHPDIYFVKLLIVVLFIVLIVKCVK